MTTTMNHEPRMQEAPVDQQLAMANRLPADMMLLKMENESIMAVARTAPRNPAKILAQLKELIEAYPAAADEAIYSKPVGTVTQVTCGNKQCGVKYEVNKVQVGTTSCPACESRVLGTCKPVKKFADGLSIRAAESIRSIYGYTRLATTTEVLPDGSVKLTGVLVDYAAGNVTSDERIVSRRYKSYEGKMVELPEDRFFNVTVKAEKAKLRRDVILDNTPNIVKALFRDECEKKLTALVAPELIEQKVLPAFAEFGVRLEHLEKIVGRPFKLGWREEDRLMLRKILTAIKNEETSVADLLAGLDEKSTGKEGAKRSRHKESDLNEEAETGEAEGRRQEAAKDQTFKQPAGGERAAGGVSRDSAPSDASATPADSAAQPTDKKSPKRRGGKQTEEDTGAAQSRQADKLTVTRRAGQLEECPTLGDVDWVMALVYADDRYTATERKSIEELADARRKKLER